MTLTIMLTINLTQMRFTENEWPLLLLRRSSDKKQICPWNIRFRESTANEWPPPPFRFGCGNFTYVRDDSLIDVEWLLTLVMLKLKKSLKIVWKKFEKSLNKLWKKFDKSLKKSLKKVEKSLKKVWKKFEKSLKKV